MLTLHKILHNAKHKIINNSFFRQKTLTLRTRPALPRRCLRLAFEVNCSTSSGILLTGSYELSFTRAVSMTIVQSGIVTDVSPVAIKRSCSCWLGVGSYFTYSIF